MRDMQTGCSNKPVAFVDLFCGMGGFCYGAERAGAICILAVDNWLPALKVHRANNFHTPMMLTLGSPDWFIWLNRFLEPYRGKYHIHIHGSPPCQAISNASNRNPDEGMEMVLWFLDLIERVEPDSWSMENVTPIKKRLPQETPHQDLNSADFGVPQTRIRTWAGEGWVPQTTHTEEDWVSVAMALPHLLKEIQVEYSLKAIKLEALGANANRRQDRTILQPSKTICGSGNQVGPRLFNHTYEPRKIRSLNIEETLELQGFPNTYDLSKANTQKQRWTMIGNAVPPMVAKGVIRGIIK